MRNFIIFRELFILVTRKVNYTNNIKILLREDAKISRRPKRLRGKATKRSRGPDNRKLRSEEANKLMKSSFWSSKTCGESIESETISSQRA